VEKLIGALSITTACETAEEKQQLVDEINRVAQPPQPVTIDTVYIGLLHAASNEINLQGGCFEAAELTLLSQLIVDAPVMVGHQKQELPIGRVFRGEVVHRDGIPWLQAFFYWHRDQRDADALKAGIDAGIYKECSLGFLYGKPECCICREDMRHCRHRPNEVVRLGGRDVRAFYYYKQIEKVLEVSLVYRGAVSGTRVSTLAVKAGESTTNNPFWRSRAEVVFDLAQIKTPLAEVLIEPLYHGVWLDIRFDCGKLMATAPDGTIYHHPILDELSHCTDATDFRVVAQMVPVKGASRLPLETLRRIQDGRGIPRCRLSLVDVLRFDGVDLQHTPLAERKAILTKRFSRTNTIAPMPHYRCPFVDVQEKAYRKGSGDGLRIIDLSSECDNPVFEIRHKPQVRGRVVVEPQVHRGNNVFGITFDGADAGTQFRLIGANSLSAGDIVWALPEEDHANRFRFFDTCLGDDTTDSASVVTTLLSSRNAETFRLLVDSHGDYWLELHHSLGFKVAAMRGGNPTRLAGSHRLACELIDLHNQTDRPHGRVALIDCGKIVALHETPTGRTLISLAGAALQGDYVFEPTRFGTKTVWLFGRTGRSD
jgi:hypothetical protein